MKKIFTLIAFVSVFAFCANAQKTEVTTIKKATAAINFDGFIDADDAWADDNWMDIALTKSPAQANDADYTSKFQMMYTDEAIVIAVVVGDDTQDGTAANSYERDNVEIFFNMDPTYTLAAYQPGIWQFRAQRVQDEALNSGNGLGYFDGSANVTSALIPSADFKWGTDDSGTEYTWELSFPIAVLKETGNFDNETFNFDIAVANGVDGKRTGQHFWGSNSDSQWNTATVFSPVKLESKLSAKEMSAAKGSAFVKNNVLNVKNVNGLVSIFSVNGSLVSKAIVNGNGSIDIADLKSGIYFIKGNNISEKFVK